MTKELKKFLSLKSNQIAINTKNFNKLFENASTYLEYSDIEDLLKILNGIGLQFKKEELPKKYILIKSVINRPCRFINYQTYLTGYEDEEETNYYRDLEHIKGIIINPYSDENYDPSLSNDENFENMFWTVDFENGDTIEDIPGTNLEVF